MSHNENKDVNNLEDTPTSPELIKSRDKLRSDSSFPIELMIMLAGESTPQVDVNVIKLDDGNPVMKNSDKYKLKLSIQNPALGIHVFPPLIQDVKFIPQIDQKVGQTDAYLPDHLPFQPLPEPLPKGQQVRAVVPPDEREIFKDTSYPWSTIGRVENAVEFGTGVMVGPRHLLTAGHLIRWNSDGTAGYLKFAPAYYDGSTPFGEAYAIKIYCPEGIIVNTSDGYSDNEMRHDFVVVVLNTRIRDNTGWMGSKRWSNSWNSMPYWTHVGYPVDLTQAKKPTYQKGIAMAGDSNLEHTLIQHRADVYYGQSGGPFFSIWDSKPYIVATFCAMSGDVGWACGSEHMVQLIDKALRDFP